MKTKPLSFRVTMPLYEKLEGLASKKQQSVGDFCRVLLKTVIGSLAEEGQGSYQEIGNLLQFVSERISEREKELERQYLLEKSVLNEFKNQVEASRVRLEKVVGIQLTFSPSKEGGSI